MKGPFWQISSSRSVLHTAVSDDFPRAVQSYSRECLSSQLLSWSLLHASQTRATDGSNTRGRPAMKMRSSRTPAGQARSSSHLPSSRASAASAASESQLQCLGCQSSQPMPVRCLKALQMLRSVPMSMGPLLCPGGKLVRSGSSTPGLLLYLQSCPQLL